MTIKLKLKCRKSKWCYHFEISPIVIKISICQLKNNVRAFMDEVLELKPDSSMRWRSLNLIWKLVIYSKFLLLNLTVLKNTSAWKEGFTALYKTWQLISMFEYTPMMLHREQLLSECVTTAMTMHLICQHFQFRVSSLQHLVLPKIINLFWTGDFK